MYGSVVRVCLEGIYCTSSVKCIFLLSEAVFYIQMVCKSVLALIVYTHDVKYLVHYRRMFLLYT